MRALTVQLFRPGSEHAPTRANELYGVAVGDPLVLAGTAGATGRTAPVPHPRPAERLLLREADRRRRPPRVRAVHRPAVAPRHRARRRRPPHEHVAGLQLPRRRRRRLGRHLVRGHPDPGAPRPAVPRPRRPAEVPRSYDVGFLHWLHGTGGGGLPGRQRPRALQRRPGSPPLRPHRLPRAHRVRDAAHPDVVQRYRDLGGNLAFLSANNFFWRVDRRTGR